MQTTIYLIRHGEVHNPNGIIYGRLPNFNLTENGRNQIEQTANFLIDKHIEIIYSSPLERAKETAEIIKNKLHIPVIQISDQLLEVKTSYQGKKHEEVDPIQAQIYTHPLSLDDETIEQLAKRMYSLVKDIIKTYQGKNIVIVSHGDPIMALRAQITHTPFDVVEIKTDHYVQHGEVHEIIANDDENLSIKSIFKPHK